MGKFQQKFSQFMYGRYGMDEYGRHLSIIALVLIIAGFVIGIVGQIININLIMWLAQGISYTGVAVMIYYFVRCFSRNIPKRREQNMKYLQRKNKKDAAKRKAENKKNYKYLTCPNCGQEMRVPRGKGKIAVSCPKCGQKTLTTT